MRAAQPTKSAQTGKSTTKPPVETTPTAAKSTTGKTSASKETAASTGAGEAKSKPAKTAAVKPKPQAHAKSEPTPQDRRAMTVVASADVLAYWRARSDRNDGLQRMRPSTPTSATNLAISTPQRCRGALVDWERDADGALAHIVVLDQFSRNIFRGSAGAFAADFLPMARAAAGRAIARGFDRQLAKNPELTVVFISPSCIRKRSPTRNAASRAVWRGR